MRPCADEVDFQVDLRLTWGRPEANVLNVLVNTWNWMRSTWGWLEVDLQVYFVGTRPARFSKNVIYDIGTKILLLKKCVFFLTDKSRFWKMFLQPFLDLINSKCCTHEYKLLNFSDLKKVDKTFFKNAIYQSEKKTHFFSKRILIPMSYIGSPIRQQQPGAFRSSFGSQNVDFPLVL